VLSIALLGTAGCGARTPEAQPAATIEKPASSLPQPSPPLTTEPPSLETFDVFLDRA